MGEGDGNGNTWTTAITAIQPNRVAVRGRDIAELMGSLSFGGAVHLILRGELPTEHVSRVMDAILVSSIDHGVTPPSVLAARNAASTGAPLSGCVASGMLAINRFHGGAIEDCARQLREIVKRCDETEESVHCVAEAMVDELKRGGKRMAGFGHRIHTNDPRTSPLFEIARESGVDGRHMEAAEAVEAVFRAAGKPIPMNVDGAIAAILADLRFEPEVMNGIFMIARAPGLVAHAVEERSTQRPMRRIDASAHRYEAGTSRGEAST